MQPLKWLLLLLLSVFVCFAFIQCFTFDCLAKHILQMLLPTCLGHCCSKQRANIKPAESGGEKKHGNWKPTLEERELKFVYDERKQLSMSLSRCFLHHIVFGVPHYLSTFRIVSLFLYNSFLHLFFNQCTHFVFVYVFHSIPFFDIPVVWMHRIQNLSAVTMRRSFE